MHTHEHCECTDTRWSFSSIPWILVILEQTYIRCICMPPPKYVNLIYPTYHVRSLTVNDFQKINQIKWDHLKRMNASSPNSSAPVISSNCALSFLSISAFLPVLIGRVSSLYPKSPWVRREGSWKCLEPRLTCHASRTFAYKVDAYALARRGWMACVLYIRDTVLAGGQVG